MTTIVEKVKDLNVIQDQKSFLDVAQLRFAKILIKQERATLLWISGVSIHYLPSYELPLKELLRREVLNVMAMSYTRGRSVLANELGKPTLGWTESGRIRAKATIMADALIATIENELKMGWIESATSKQNKDWWRYHTKKTFAELGGWRIPDGI